MTNTTQTIGFAGSQVNLAPNRISDGIIDPDTGVFGIDHVTDIHVLRDSKQDDYIVVDNTTFTNSFGNFIEVRLTSGDDYVEFVNVVGRPRVSYKIAEGGVSVNMVDTAGPGGSTIITTTATDFGNPVGTFIGTDTIIQNSRVRGSDFADELFGSNRTDKQENLRGSGGVDYIDGRLGEDLLEHGDSSSGHRC